MSYKEIPLLTARDVELRAAQFFDDSVVMLVYKDARVDMRLLDECFGWQNWQRKHQVIDGNLYCSVLIKNQETGEWIEKQDVGTPSKTEAEKGNASDSFKRACFNVGIGRELYDAPFIKIPFKNTEIGVTNKGSKYLKVKLKVAYMQYNKTLGQFDEFVVVDNWGNVRFKLDNANSGTPKEENNASNAPNLAYNKSNQAANINIAPQEEKPLKTQNNSELRCCNCGANIEQKVYNFSMQRYKQPLCYKCQKDADKLNKIYGK